MEDISKVLVAPGKGRTEILDLGWTEYRDLPAINPSTIVRGLPPGSMKHLHHAWYHDRPDTDEMLWGRAVHCLLFEPREFEERYVAWDGRRAGKEYVAYQEEAWCAGREVLRATGRHSLESAIEAAKSFVSEPKVQKLIKHGKAEVTLLAEDHGFQCRGRVDWISAPPRDVDAIVDLKTATSIHSRAFGRSFYRYHYDVKLGLYERWLHKISGMHFPVEVICLESSPPYDVAVVPVPDAVLDRGAAKGLGVLDQLKRCIETDTWPGVAGGEYYFLDTPTYEMDDDDLDLEGVDDYQE